ncbi:MAG: HAD family hydrolase [Candidatus Omnitrophota bacterium]
MVDVRVNSRSIEDIRLFIFDKDGTLMDLYRYWSHMVGYRVELAAQRLGLDDAQKSGIVFAMGVDSENKRLRARGPVGIMKREIVMKAMESALDSMGFHDTHGLCFDVFQQADSYSLDHMHEIVRPVSGMHRLLSALHGRGCRIALATTDKTERAKLAVKYLGISDIVDIIVGEDMVRNYKPHPDMAVHILRALGIEKEHAVMVGDSVTDIEMGINAGLRAAIAVCSGISSREQFSGKTEHIIGDISEIQVV